MPKFIGIGHRSGHGKDTFARLLETDLRIKCPKIKIKTVSFASKLKDICHQIYGWAGLKPAIAYENNRDLRKVVLPELGLTAVDIWVLVGEALRDVYALSWVKHVMCNYGDFDIIIISDLRHPNEIDEIKTQGGITIKVHNNRVENREPPSIDDMLEDYDAWTAVVHNQGSLKDLNSEAVALSDLFISDWGLNENK